MALAAGLETAYRSGHNKSAHIARMSDRSSEDCYSNHTNQLPELREPIGLDDPPEPPFALPRAEKKVERPGEHTSEHTVYATHLNGALDDLPEGRSDHKAVIAEFVAQLAAQTRRGDNLERRLDEEQRLNAEREHALVALREFVQDASRSQQRAATQLAGDARTAELVTTVEALQEEADSRLGEIERFRAAAETAQHEADSARRELAAHRAAQPPPPNAQLLEDNAALRSYIDSRRAWWDEAQEKQTSLGTRLAALEQQLAASAEQLSAAEALAAQESTCATALRAELVDYSQRVSALERELREQQQSSDPPARDTTSEVEGLRRDLVAARAELDETRLSVARLERAVIDKDRVLDARGTRIATLHEQLTQQLSAIEKFSATDVVPPKLDSGMTAQTGPADTGLDISAPELLCLTGEAPKRFVLLKEEVTVGRGRQCDLQIRTHFVSREHARITLNGGTAVIEDLRSRNGVFVNSVRIDRQVLLKGDLVLIGETLFRFVESTAH